MTQMKSGLLALIGFLAIENVTGLVDPMKHAISIVTPQNFESVIRKEREFGVSSLMFYGNDATSKSWIDGWYNDAAAEVRGMLRLAAVDCTKHKKFCDAHNTKKTLPCIAVYPPNPMPISFYEGKLEKGPFISFLSRFIPHSNVKTVTAQSIDAFVAERPEMPKVLLFSAKDKTPTLFAALANAFHKEIHFGFVPGSETAVAKRYNATKLPQMIVLRGTKKPERYADEMKYEPMHTWINLFRETFVQGGGFSGSADTVPAVEKPWLSDPLPELYKESANHLCFKRSDKSLCVIYITDGPLDAAARNDLLALKERFTSGLDGRGLTFSWMWLDGSVHTEWKKMFGVSATPSAVVFNPNKRLRFMRISQEPATTASVGALVDLVSGGDARFTPVPGQTLPAFANVAKGRDEL